MKIDLEIPDWVVEEKRRIWVMAGIEIVAYKEPWEEKWKVKTGRCNFCGKCCRNFGEVSGDLKEMVEGGSCKYLVPDGDKWVCSLGASRPFGCSTAVSNETFKDCSEQFQEV